MFCYIVKKTTTFIGSSDIRSFHYNMFHGAASREGVAYPNERQLHYGSADRAPLHISRTGNSMPPIFQPSMNLVVSETVKNKLENIQPVEFIQIVFDKLFKMEYTEGDFSWYDNGHNISEDNIHLVAPHESAFERSTPLYYELLSPRLSDLRIERTCATHRVKLGLSPNDEIVELRVDSRVVEQYPILWHEGTHVFSAKAFELIGPFLNVTYFNVTTVTLD